MVVVDGKESESITATSCVPQGSVLGPVLLLIYSNYMPYGISSLFADDASLYLTTEGGKDSSALQDDFDKLVLWEFRWDMEFNPSK